MATFDPGPLRLYLCSLVDEAARKRIAANPTNAHSVKLEEARDVIDQLFDTNNPSAAQRIRAMSAQELLASYPMLATGIGLDGPDIETVARLVWDNAIAQRSPTALIERTRRLARKSINAAETKEAAEKAYLAVQWPE